MTDDQQLDRNLEQIHQNLLGLLDFKDDDEVQTPHFVEQASADFEPSCSVWSDDDSSLHSTVSISRTSLFASSTLNTENLNQKRIWDWDELSTTFHPPVKDQPFNSTYIKQQEDIYYNYEAPQTISYWQNCSLSQAQESESLDQLPVGRWMEQNRIEALGIGPNIIAKCAGERVRLKFDLAYNYLAELSDCRADVLQKWTGNKPDLFDGNVALFSIFKHFLCAAQEECSQVCLVLNRLCDNFCNLDALVHLQWALHRLQKYDRMTILNDNACSLTDKDEADLLIKLLNDVIGAFRMSSVNIWALRTLAARPASSQPIACSQRSNMRTSRIRRIG